ncbi:MAG: hypothetical protein RIS47_644 [Bacteroidota bacterium]|jgi:acetyl esterase/lipase
MKTQILVLLLLCSTSLLAQHEPREYIQLSNISYLNDTTKADAYQQSRCKLDIYYPTDTNGFATVIWFHGGSLQEGEKYIPAQLQDQQIAIVSVNYRLNPKVQSPAYINDAAAAVGWVYRHIAQYGGSTQKIFLSGHSAGGYLTLMLGLDPKYLAHEGISTSQLAGIIPFSGQTLTHLTIREERKLAPTQLVADSMAPIYHTAKGFPPTILITGDREFEIPCRYEENALLCAQLRFVNPRHVKLYELKGFDHGTMVAPACLLLLHQIHAILSQKP